ncbi:MAG: peptide chain release factor 2 [Clostridia bacterium]|nr:peptide chain release factor 2 [Clostridia bacterium]
MIEIDGLLKENQSQLLKIKELKNSISLNDLENELKQLEIETSKYGFWNNPETSSKVSGRIAEIKKKITKYKKIENEIIAVGEMLELLKEENDEDYDLKSEVENSIKKITKKLEELEIQTLFSDKYDKNNAIITIHPGAGGTEAMDWAEMLYRMYVRWAEANDFKLEELDYLAGDEAGVKSVTFSVMGDYAYGYLKSEHGVHRLVRISPFDAGGRRHTSFASIEVLPEIDDNEDVYINPDDIKMDVFRASGAGGQHINKTSSAVRLTHIPTGIIVSCQTQRSQFQNKDTAMKMLKSKLINLKEKENKETIEDLKGIQMDIAWGSQIRSYVFCPYTMVKDHRTNYEVGNVQKVMDGDLNEFIFAYLKFMSK